MDIPDISTEGINIRELDIGPINIWTAPEVRTPSVPPIYPVTNMIGVPIVDMPGCVEAHEQNDPDEADRLGQFLTGERWQWRRQRRRQ